GQRRAAGIGRAIERAHARIRRQGVSARRHARGRCVGRDSMITVAMRSLAIGAAAALCAALSGCGGGGGGGGSSTPTPPPMPTQNVQTVSVEQGPGGFVNILFTSVTI